MDLDFPTLFHRAVRIVPMFRETHALKGVLALRHLKTRFPHWKESDLASLKDWPGFLGDPHTNALFHSGISPLESVPPEKARHRMETGLFPLAYTAAASWERSEGLETMVMAYRERAVRGIEDLGHSWSIWCSFVEALPDLRDAETRQFAAERFAEFVGQQFRKDPANRPLSPAPSPPEVPGAVDPAGLLDLCLERPGFLGHHLLALGTLHRFRHLLDAPLWNLGLSRIRAMASLRWNRPAFDVRLPEEPIPRTSPEEHDLEVSVRDFLLRGTREVHVLTVADIACALWDVAEERQRHRLLRYLGSPSVFR